MDETSHQGVEKVVGVLPALSTDDSVKVILPGTSMSKRWIFLNQAHQGLH